MPKRQKLLVDSIIADLEVSSGSQVEIDLAIERIAQIIDVSPEEQESALNKIQEIVDRKLDVHGSDSRSSSSSSPTANDSIAALITFIKNDQFAPRVLSLAKRWILARIDEDANQLEMITKELIREGVIELPKVDFDENVKVGEKTIPDELKYMSLQSFLYLMERKTLGRVRRATIEQERLLEDIVRVGTDDAYSLEAAHEVLGSLQKKEPLNQFQDQSKVDEETLLFHCTRNVS